MTKSNSRIVCAAIRAEDGEILIGIRHYSMDMIRQIEARPDGKKFHQRYRDDQGFVDQFGKYYTRKEAYEIAKNNNQIIRDFERYPLYSEHLY